MKFARTKTASTITAGLTIAACALMLTGCAGGQSKADACKDIMTKVKSVSDNIQQNSSELAQNPEKASAAISDLSNTFSKAVGDVKQEDVKKAANKAATSLDNFATEFQTVAKDPQNADTTKIAKLSGDMTDSFSNLQDVCNGK